MESHRECRPGPSGEPVLAAQIVAIGIEEQFSSIDQAKSLTIAVMGRRDPLLAFVFGPLACDRCRRPPRRPSSRISAEFVSATTSTECAALARDTRHQFGLGPR